MQIREMAWRAIERWPDPPRPVEFGRMLLTSVRSAVGLAAGLFGTVTSIAGVGFLVAARGGILAEIIGTVFLLAGLAILIVPIIYAWRVTRAIRYGLRCKAVVISMLETDRSSRATLDSMRNGLAAGVRRIVHPLGDFEERFQYDGPGAAELRTGDAMVVLVAPRRRKVILDLGAGRP